jgi:hypothetical protein
VPGSAFIDSAGAPCVLVLRHVRCYRRFSQITHEISRIVVLVPSQRHTRGASWNPCHHFQSIGEVALTSNEYKDGPALKNDYWLYVVFDYAGTPRITSSGFSEHQVR